MVFMVHLQMIYRCFTIDFHSISQPSTLKKPCGLRQLVQASARTTPRSSSATKVTRSMVFETPKDYGNYDYNYGYNYGYNML